MTKVLNAVLNNPKNIKKIAKILKKRYRDYSHNNRFNPLDELLFILCSVKTSSGSYEAVYKNFRKAFPSFQSIYDASERDIAKQLIRGGLYYQRAQAIKKIMQKIHEKFGILSLSPLKTMDNTEIEKFLISLPRVGKKVAKCVMMYSLGHKVFPVDTHCWRISKRIGWITTSSKSNKYSDKDMDRLEKIIPANLRYSIHVNFVSLGKDICTAINPKCNKCVIAKHCNRIFV